MKQRNTGKEYEKFVESLYQAVLTTDKVTENLRNLRFERNKRFRARYGTPREFDVYWEYELDDVVTKTVIECKDYQSTIEIAKIDALVGKLGDIDDDLIPVFATKTGYQSGAKKAADYHGIELLIVREQNDSDWKAEDGMAFVRYLQLNLMVDFPSRIFRASFTVDEDWVKKHRPDIDTSVPINEDIMNDETFIDEDGEQRYSILDLASRRLPFSSGGEYGIFQRTIEYPDAFLIHPTQGKLKLVSVTVDYATEPPIRETSTYDRASALLGVIEYVQKGEKKLVFKDQDFDNVVTRKLSKDK